jgi:hypothetical protein
LGSSQAKFPFIIGADPEVDLLVKPTFPVGSQAIKSSRVLAQIFSIKVGGTSFRVRRFVTKLRFFRWIIVAVIGTDDQLILAEKSNQVRQLFIGLTSHPQPVFAEEFLRVVELPIALLPSQHMPDIGTQLAAASIKPKRNLGNRSGIRL